MLKISFVRNQERNVRLVLEGKIVGPWVEELNKSCGNVLSRGDGLTLDLVGVSFVDHSGLSLLKMLELKGVTLARCSNFVAEQLKGS